MSKCPKCGAPARHSAPDGDFRYCPPTPVQKVQESQTVSEDVSRAALADLLVHSFKDNADYLSRKLETVSAKLKLAEAALERISSPTQTERLLWWQTEARSALHSIRGEERQWLTEQDIDQ